MTEKKWFYCMNSKQNVKVFIIKQTLFEERVHCANLQNKQRLYLENQNSRKSCLLTELKHQMEKKRQLVQSWRNIAPTQWVNDFHYILGTNILSICQNRLFQRFTHNFSHNFNFSLLSQCQIVVRCKQINIKHNNNQTITISFTSLLILITFCVNKYFHKRK